MTLPQEFTERMKQMLGDEYQEFLAGYEGEHYQALRLNPAKCKAGDKERIESHAGFSLRPVPWCDRGYYYAKGDTPGKHPYHEAGVYYMQEPSAMAPAEYLFDETVRMERERVLDLCAAPGGKSTQIAGKMAGRGLLVCNEIHPARAKILSENIERMGVLNALVLNEKPEHLAERFPLFFTRILVDAPCSGEGMFRKNEEACTQWSPTNVEICAQRQDMILDQAAAMLAPGGRLVYSTCTFAPIENEGSISRFLTRHPEFSILPAARCDGMQPAVPAWGDGNEDLAQTIRLWPHKLHGEGHYLAVLKKEGMFPETTSDVPSGRAVRCVEWEAFQKEELRQTVLPQRELLFFGDQLYLAPPMMPSLKGLKVLRPGLHLGTVKKNRFEPAHALALALTAEDVVRAVELSAVSPDAACRYVGGETLRVDEGSEPAQNGWCLVTVDGYSIGWGKKTGGMIKNHYPKGLRKRL